MYGAITQEISQDPTTGNRRMVDTEILFLKEGIVFLMVVTFVDKDGSALPNVGSKKYVFNTAGEYVDSKGAKRKNGKNAIKKEDFIIAKPNKIKGNKSFYDDLKEVFMEQVDTLDGQGYFK